MLVVGDETAFHNKKLVLTRYVYIGINFGFTSQVHIKLFRGLI